MEGPDLCSNGVLPGEELQCFFMGFTEIPSIEWFRDGVRLTEVEGKLMFEAGARDSTLKFLTADAIVDGSYTCTATLGATTANTILLYLSEQV